MTVTIKAFIDRKYAESSQTTQYTASNCKARIDKFTVTNNSANNVTFACNVVEYGGSVSNSNRIINRTIPPTETYLCPEMVGQVLETGGFISTIAGTASALTLSVCGVEIV